MPMVAHRLVGWLNVPFLAGYSAPVLLNKMPTPYTAALRLSELIPNQELRLPASGIILGSQKKDEIVENAIARVIEGRYPTKGDAVAKLIQLFEQSVKHLPLCHFSRVLYWQYVADDWLNVSKITLDGDIVRDLVLTIARSERNDEAMEFMLEVKVAETQPNVFLPPAIQRMPWKNLVMPLKQNKKARANQIATVNQVHQYEYGGAQAHEDGADTEADPHERELEKMFADNSDTREPGNDVPPTDGDVDMTYGDIPMTYGDVDMADGYGRPRGKAKVVALKKAEADAVKKAEVDALNKAKAAKSVFTLTCRSRRSRWRLGHPWSPADYAQPWQSCVVEECLTDSVSAFADCVHPRSWMTGSSWQVGRLEGLWALIVAEC
ncbi:hypothetical protein GE09DRAFT_1187192 [Coniochaeta sp. 2T2.1]|nr:hypothetical protein GE09DRAFT_1187192 [Coniochaeta sp. 2T2.1]